MPTTGLSLTRTNRPYTRPLSGLTLPVPSVSNPSDGVYRYDFDFSSVSGYTYDQLGGIAGFTQNGTNLAGTLFVINIGYSQMYNYDGNNFTIDGTYNPNYWLNFTPNPNKDNMSWDGVGVAEPVPTARNSAETAGNFGTFLGDTTYGYSDVLINSPVSSLLNNSVTRYWVTASPVTTYRVEVNWNQVALNETTYTTTSRKFGRLAAGRVKLAFQPGVYYDTRTDLDTGYGIYLGKPRFVNTTVSGSNLATFMGGATPTDINSGSFGYPSGTRSFTWTEPANSDYYNPYIYVYYWTGSAWAYLREGFISDGNQAWLTSSTKNGDFSRYTLASGDPTNYYYIGVYNYNGYRASFSANAAYSNYIYA